MTTTVTLHYPSSGQAGKLAVLLDALDGVVISDAGSGPR